MTMAPEAGVRPLLRAALTGKRLSERCPSLPGVLETSSTEWSGSEAPRGSWSRSSAEAPRGSWSWSSGATPVCWLAVAATLLPPLATAAGTQVRRVGRRSSPASKVLELSRSTAQLDATREGHSGDPQLIGDLGAIGAQPWPLGRVLGGSGSDRALQHPKVVACQLDGVVHQISGSLLDDRRRSSLIVPTRPLTHNTLCRRRDGTQRDAATIVPPGTIPIACVPASQADDKLCLSAEVDWLILIFSHTRQRPHVLLGRREALLLHDETRKPRKRVPAVLPAPGCCCDRCYVFVCTPAPLA